MVFVLISLNAPVSSLASILNFLVDVFQYFMKTQKCKFGHKCKFNHPKDQIISLVGAIGMRFLLRLCGFFSLIVIT